MSVLRICMTIAVAVFPSIVIAAPPSLTQLFPAGIGRGGARMAARRGEAARAGGGSGAVAASGVPLCGGGGGLLLQLVLLQERERHVQREPHLLDVLPETLLAGGEPSY